MHGKLKQEFNKIASDLCATNNNDIIKISGIMTRFKNFLKKITNPQYREDLAKLNEETKDVKNIIVTLYKSFKELSNIIRDGEVDKYHNKVNEIKQHLDSFTAGFNTLHNDVETSLRYGLEEFKHPGFLDKFKTTLPSDFNIELQKEYNQPLKSFEYYANIKPDDILYSDIVKGNFIREIIGLIRKINAKSLNEIFKNSNLTEMQQNLLMENLQNAIVNGSLISAYPLSPRNVKKKFTQTGAPEEVKVHFGSIVLKIKTDKILIPINTKLNESVSFNVVVELIDRKTSKDYRNKFAIKSTSKPQNIETNNINDAPKTVGPTSQITDEEINKLNISESDIDKTTSRKQKLQKLAQYNLVPKQNNKLTEMELANALIKGYKNTFGHEPSLETLGIAFSQIILENGRPVVLPNNNIGNIRATPEWIKSGKPYFSHKSGEYSKNGNEYIIDEATWRAFDTPEEGAKAYWKLIGKKYNASLNWMKSGDVKSAMVTMGLGGYYTASIEIYSNEVNTIYHNFFLKQIAPNLNLKSEIKPLPITKPQVKKWKADYSDEEIKQILSQTNSKTNLEYNSEINNDNFKSLLSELSVASTPITNLIKNALQPKYDILIKINSKKGSFKEKLEYARIVSSLLRKFKSKPIIFGSHNNIDIQASFHGDKELVIGAVQELCDALSINIKPKLGYSIHASVIPDMLTKYNMIDYETIISNYRVLQINRMVK